MSLPMPTPGSEKWLRLPDVGMRHWLADYGQHELADDLVERPVPWPAPHGFVLSMRV
jgi:hypothetical protein